MQCCGVKPQQNYAGLLPGFSLPPRAIKASADLNTVDLCYAYYAAFRK
jgi:hypothetical protein